MLTWMLGEKCGSWIYRSSGPEQKWYSKGCKIHCSCNYRGLSTLRFAHGVVEVTGKLAAERNVYVWWNASEAREKMLPWSGYEFFVPVSFCCISKQLHWNVRETYAGNWTYRVFWSNAQCESQFLEVVLDSGWALSSELRIKSLKKVVVDTGAEEYSSGLLTLELNVWAVSLKTW